MEPSEACELCAFPKTAREQEERIAALRARLAAVDMTNDDLERQVDGYKARIARLEEAARQAIVALDGGAEPVQWDFMDCTICGLDKIAWYGESPCVCAPCQVKRLRAALEAKP